MALNVGGSNGCSRAHRFTANSQQRGSLRRPVDTRSAPPDAGVPRGPLPSPGDERRGPARGGHRRGRRVRRPLRRRDTGDDGRPRPRVPPARLPARRARRRSDDGRARRRPRRPVGGLHQQRRRGRPAPGGGGLAGLWLMRGMRPDGVLTALDGDPEQLRAARKAFADAGIAPGRMRLIFGTPAEVLPRLSPGAYDMVVCAGPPREYSEHLRALLDLVRVGGSLVCHGLLEGMRVAERTVRDPQTVAWRQISHTIRDDETLLSAVLPIGNGLLVATKRA